MVTQASVSLINNQGNIKQTLKDLGSKQSVRQLGFAIASAGIGSKINKSLGLSNTDITQAGFNDRLIKGIADGTSRGLLESAVYGVDLEEAIIKNLRGEIAGLVASEAFANYVKPLDKEAFIDNLAHKMAAGMTGCLSAKIAGDHCEAGAIGAFVGEVWGDFRVDDPNTLTDKQKEAVINQAKLLASIAAAAFGEDASAVANVAEMSVKWNTNNEILLEVERDMAWELANGDRDLYFKLLSTGYRLEIVANSLVDLHNQYNDITIMNLSMGVSGATIIINNKNGKVFRSVHPNINISNKASVISRPKANIGFGSVLGKNSASDIDKAIEGASFGFQGCYTICVGKARTRDGDIIYTYGLGIPELSSQSKNVNIEAEASTMKFTGIILTQEELKKLINIQ